MTVLSRFRGLEGTGTGRYRPALEHVEHEQARPWAALWRDTAEGCGLVHKVVVPAGVTVVVPVIRGLRRDQGRPLTLVAEMVPTSLSIDHLLADDGDKSIHRLAYRAAILLHYDLLPVTEGDLNPPAFVLGESAMTASTRSG